jgi:hypothetical protein
MQCNCSWLGQAGKYGYCIFLLAHDGARTPVAAVRIACQPIMLIPSGSDARGQYLNDATI